MWPLCARRKVSPLQILDLALPVAGKNGMGWVVTRDTMRKHERLLHHRSHGVFNYQWPHQAAHWADTLLPIASTGQRNLVGPKPADPSNIFFPEVLREYLAVHSLDLCLSKHSINQMRCPSYYSATSFVNLYMRRLVNDTKSDNVWKPLAPHWVGQEKQNLGRTEDCVRTVSYVRRSFEHLIFSVILSSVSLVIKKIWGAGFFICPRVWPPIDPGMRTQEDDMNHNDAPRTSARPTAPTRPQSPFDEDDAREHLRDDQRINGATPSAKKNWFFCVFISVCKAFQGA